MNNDSSKGIGNSDKTGQDDVQRIAELVSLGAWIVNLLGFGGIGAKKSRTRAFLKDLIKRVSSAASQRFQSSEALLISLTSMLQECFKTLSIYGCPVEKPEVQNRPRGMNDSVVEITYPYGAVGH